MTCRSNMNNKTKKLIATFIAKVITLSITVHFHDNKENSYKVEGLFMGA